MLSSVLSKIVSHAAYAVFSLLIPILDTTSWLSWINSMMICCCLSYYTFSRCAFHLSMPLNNASRGITILLTCNFDLLSCFELQLCFLRNKSEFFYIHDGSMWRAFVYCAWLVGHVVGWPIKCRTKCMFCSNLHSPEWHSWPHVQWIISLFGLLLWSSCCSDWLLCDWIHMVCIYRFFFARFTWLRGKRKKCVDILILCWNLKREQLLKF